MLGKLQDEIKQWTARSFPASPWWHPLLGMGEELGELNHALLKQAQGIRGTAEEHEEAAKDALADLWIFSLDLCNKRGWDAGKILNMTWEEVCKRDWVDCAVTGLTTTDDIPLPLDYADDLSMPNTCSHQDDPMGLHRTGSRLIDVFR